MGGGAIGANDTVRLAFTVYPACEHGDGYDVPEALPACGARQSAPRAADLLIQYVTDSLKGEVQVPADGRVIRKKSTNPG